MKDSGNSFTQDATWIQTPDLRIMSSLIYPDPWLSEDTLQKVNNQSGSFEADCFRMTPLRNPERQVNLRLFASTEFK